MASALCILKNLWYSIMIHRHLSKCRLSQYCFCRGKSGLVQELSLMESVKHMDNGDMPHVA